MKTLQKLLPRVLVLFALVASTVALKDSSPPAHAIVAPGAYDAVLMQEVSLEQQARDAGLIVYGAISDVTSRKTGSTYTTEVTLNVGGTLRGTASGAFKFTLQGGSVGNAGLAVGGVPNFLEGEKVLLFFDNASNRQLLRLWQGKFSLAGPEAVQVESKTRIPVATLESRLKTVLNKNVDLPDNGPSASSQPFVTSDPCPEWALTDLPVLFDVNPTSPGSGGPTGTDFARLSYDSWHAWQALTDSYPAFTFGTITSRGQAVDGLHTVGWGNLSSGVLGVNHCAWIGSERYDSDTLIDRDSFTWDADGSNGISASAYSLQAVLEHELGHGLSLGHSDQTCNGTAATPLMCPAVSNGVRKTILTDDRSGAAFLYALTGSPPAAPSNLEVDAGDGENELTWTASTGTKHAYDIERSSNGCAGSFKSINTVAGNVTTFTDDDYGDGLGSGTWCYRVKAIGTGGDSGWSNTASPVTPPPSCAAPAITSMSDSSASGAGTVSFSWNAIQGATGYRVARHNGSSWSVITTVSGTSYSGEDTAADPQWRVYVGAGTCTPVPGPATAFDPNGIPACTAPVISSQSDSNASGAGTVYFAWNPVPGATGYRVARRQGSSWVVVATVSGTSYSGADAADDPQWRVYVGTGSCTPVPGPATAFDPTGTPSQSCTAPVITDDSDTDNSGAGTVTFSWNAIPGATGYRVARMQGGSWTVVATVFGTSYSGADTADDPQWRVYVGSGTCVPVPGPASAFDPE